MNVLSVSAQTIQMPGLYFNNGNPFTTVQIFAPPQGSGYHSHTVANWEVASVVKKGLGNASPTTYSGDLQYYVTRYWPNANHYATGTSVGTDGKIKVPQNTAFRAGDVYWVYAYLDGDIFIAKPSETSHDYTAHVSANRTWTYYQSTLNCPSLCYNIDAGWYSTPSQYLYGPAIWSSQFMKIYLPPPATVKVFRAAGVSNLQAYYLKSNSVANGTLEAQAVKTTNANGQAVFHVRQAYGTSGYGVDFGKCLHTATRCCVVQGNNPGCNCVNCGHGCTTCNVYVVSIPSATATARVKKYDVPVANAVVHLLNTAQTQFVSSSPGQTNQNGDATFTPPASSSYRYVVVSGGAQYTTGITSAPISNAIHDIRIEPKDVPTLTLPSQGAQFSNGATVSFSWGTAPSAAKYVWCIAHESQTSWSAYDMGTQRSISVALTGEGTWYWQVRVFNSSGQQIAQSVDRYLTIGGKKSSSSSNDSFYNEKEGLLLDDYGYTFYDTNSEVDQPTEQSSIGIIVMQGEKDLVPFDFNKNDFLSQKNDSALQEIVLLEIEQVDQIDERSNNPLTTSGGTLVLKPIVDQLTFEATEGGHSDNLNLHNLEEFMWWAICPEYFELYKLMLLYDE